MDLATRSLWRQSWLLEMCNEPDKSSGTEPSAIIHQLQRIILFDIIHNDTHTYTYICVYIYIVEIPIQPIHKIPAGLLEPCQSCLHEPTEKARMQDIEKCESQNNESH